VAQKLGITQTAYALWERRPTALRPEQIEKIAKILQIAVEDLFTSNGRSKERAGPVGRARRAFERVSKLPRSQQQHILKVVEGFVESLNGSAE
jgi:transcriptional regulator with XRE-family HTH domain